MQTVLIERVSVNELVEDLSEIPLFFFRHLLRLEQRVVAMAKNVGQPCKKVALFVVIGFEAGREILVAMKAGGFLHDCTEHAEVMSAQSVISFSRAKFS